MDEITNLKKLLGRRLSLLCNAERQVMNLLANVRSRINSLHLQRLVDDHLERSKLHFASLEIILSELSEKVPVEDNQSMVKLISELDSIIVKCKEVEVVDAAIIGALQNILHYLISGYGTSAAYAKSLKMTEIEKVLNNILNEQKVQDERLTRIAVDNINEKARNPILL